MKPAVRGLLILVIGLGALGWFILVYLPSKTIPKEKTAFQNLEQPNSTVPDFAATDLRGVERKLADFNRSGITVIHFWASWCAPCLDEFPSLIEFAKKNEKTLTVLALTVDENTADVVNFVNAMGGVPSNFLVLRDKGSVIATSFGTMKLPESYIVSPGRKLVRKMSTSLNWMQDDVQKLIDRKPSNL